MKKKIGIILLALIIAATSISSVVMIYDYAVSGESHRKHKKDQKDTVDKLFDSTQMTIDNTKIKVSIEVIEDGIRDMGKLITQEYYFTQTETYEKKEALGPFVSTAKIIYSYDGTVYAGIDCSEVTVKKDDEKKKIYVTLPKAKIQSVDIDFDSFKEYESKQGFWSKIKLDDVNKSLVEFENEAKSNATDKGVLEHADEYARLIVGEFIRALIGNTDYSIEFTQ